MKSFLHSFPIVLPNNDHWILIITYQYIILFISIQWSKFNIILVIHKHIAYHNNDKFSVVLFQIVPSFTIHPSICHLPIHIHSFNQFQIHSISLSIIPYHAIPIQSFHLPFLLPFLIHMHPQYLVIITSNIVLFEYPNIRNISIV